MFLIVNEKKNRMADKDLYVSINIRGVLLERTIIMERLIDLVLARYFSNGKAMDDLLNLLLCTERVSLYSKWQVIKYLVERRQTNIDAQKNRDMVLKIGRLIEERNVFAHLLMGNTEDIANQMGDEFDKNEIVHFYKHKADTKIIGYTQQKIDSLLSDLKDCSKWLTELYNSGITYPPSE